MLRGAWNIIIVDFNAAKPFGRPASNNTAILEQIPLAKKNPICLYLCLFLHWKELSLFILPIDNIFLPLTLYNFYSYRVLCM